MLTISSSFKILLLSLVSFELLISAYDSRSWRIFSFNWRWIGYWKIMFSFLRMIDFFLKYKEEGSYSIPVPGKKYFRKFNPLQREYSERFWKDYIVEVFCSDDYHHFFAALQWLWLIALDYSKKVRMNVASFNPGRILRFVLGSSIIFSVPSYWNFFRFFWIMQNQCLIKYLLKKKSNK